MSVDGNAIAAYVEQQIAPLRERIRTLEEQVAGLQPAPPVEARPSILARVSAALKEVTSR